MLFAFPSSGQSVMASGDWYKVGITESGMYRLNSSDLIALGINVDALDPSTIKIYGNGVSGILPQLNSTSRPFDLIENPIFISGESDGSFDNSDYILFYARGPHKEQWTSNGFLYEKNFYSDTAYYFIQLSEKPGKRVEPVVSQNLNTEMTIDQFDDHKFYEADFFNTITSGRYWLDERLSNGDVASFNYFFEGINGELNLTLALANRTEAEGVFSIFVNDAPVGSVEMSAIPAGTYQDKARYSTQTFSVPSDEEMTIQIRFNSSGSPARGHLDFHYLTMKRQLALYGNETTFRATDAINRTVRYVLEAPEDAIIWNITDPGNVFKVQAQFSNGTHSFIERSDRLQEYVVFRNSEFPIPFVFGKVPNQDLKSNTAYDGLIISHASFLEEAQRLAAYHEAHDNLKVKVVSVRQVYNGLSCGRQDVTAIRDYARYVYENGNQLKYLLLFGDCSYDYKDFTLNNTNFVPTYQSRESFDPVDSYASDDYFGFFEESEGEWVETFSGDHTLEIGVGRLPVKSKEEARIIVDKIIQYSSGERSLGSWKNKVVYVSDDGDNNVHSRHAEDLAFIFDTTHAEYKIDKLLLDAFEQQPNGSSQTSPSFNVALESKILEGTFLVNFIGHGNENRWMHESVFDRSTVERLNNRNKLPIFITATCEFGRYDDPVLPSGAEALLLSEQGGAIALLTTSRPVRASTNFELNEAFHKNVFRKENGSHLRLGDIIRFTKNEGLAGPINRNFTLLGDPMMMPAFPQLEIEIELNNSLDTLNALDRVTFKGRIIESGNLASDFNGIVEITLKDIPQQFLTKGQESLPFQYTMRKNVLFNGQATVENGEFEFSFVMPKNISYQFQRGKMSLYAYDLNNNIDAKGSSRDLIIGGTETALTNDDHPPQVDLFLNDESFQNGSEVGKSPLLIAHISDVNGITTTSSGIIEGISLTIGDETYNLNAYYQAAVDDYTRGTIVYPIQELDPGHYSASLTVWDTHNNLAQQEINFFVSDKPVISFFETILYPNPVLDHATLSFRHDRPGEDLIVNWSVFNSMGQVLEKDVFVIENSDRQVLLEWENRDQLRIFKNGVYYLKISVKSRRDGASNEITERLLLQK
jgi:hypothetical protein